MMPATCAPPLDRLVYGEELEDGWWSSISRGAVDVRYDDALPVDGGDTPITALERRAREERWACEWWPPD